MMRVLRAFPKRSTAFACAVAAAAATLPAGTAMAQSGARRVKLEVTTHIENDRNDRRGTDSEWVGTRGQSRRLEAFRIAMVNRPPGLGIQYYCHPQDVGDTDWVTDERDCGTRNQSRRLEGFAVALNGSQAHRYTVEYQCHVQNTGDTGLMRDGQFCGSRGANLRVEAIRVLVRRVS